MKTINTTRFGNIEIQDEHIIHFKDGMIGFHKHKNYVLIESGSMPLLLWLQSVDDADIAFPVIEPYFFRKDYKAPLNDADKHSLSFVEGDITKAFVVMTIPDNMVQMTVNMKAPVVIDITQGTGAQVILLDKNLEVRTSAHEAFHRAISSFAIQQSADDASPNVVDSWNTINYRSVSQGFSATV